MNTIAQTNRLIIRSWIPEEDAESAFEIYSDPEVTRFLITKTTSVEDAIKLLQRWVMLSNQLNGGGLWAILNKEAQEIVGTIILIPLRDEAEKWRSTITSDMPSPALVVEVVSLSKINADRDY